MENDKMVFSDLKMLGGGGKISEKYFHNLAYNGKELFLVQLFRMTKF